MGEASVVIRALVASFAVFVAVACGGTDGAGDYAPPNLFVRGFVQLNGVGTGVAVQGCVPGPPNVDIEDGAVIVVQDAGASAAGEGASAPGSLEAITALTVSFPSTSRGHDASEDFTLVVGDRPPLAFTRGQADGLEIRD
jgi:hypothetical protein